MNSSAFYTAGKLNKDLVGTGVSVSAATRVLLGPLKPSSSGTMSFKLKGSATGSLGTVTGEGKIILKKTEDAQSVLKKEVKKAQQETYQKIKRIDGEIYIDDE